MKEKTNLTPRRMAAAVLAGVLDDKQTLDICLAAAFTENKAQGGTLSARDRAFVRHLVATTLRRLGNIDAVLKKKLKRPLPRRAVAARHALRLGVAQILFMNVPDFAAVDTSVRLVSGHRQAQVRALKGLVNGLLRNVAREKQRLRKAAAAKPIDNLPGWLSKSWAAHLDKAEILDIARILVQEPPLDLTPRDAADAAKLAAELNAELLPNGSVRLAAGGDIRALPGFEEGRWWVQDAAASLAVRLLGDVRGKRVADLCAAPGGKALQLAAAGARVTAVDRSAARLERLAENLARTGLSVDVVTSDVRKFRPAMRFDGVLLDAPCSATGTLRRHPDVGWIKGPAEIAALAEIQRELLDHALGLLAPGGRLVYCVCSLQPEEGPEQISALLARSTEVELSPVAPGELPGLDAAITAAGTVRTHPGLWAAEGSVKGGVEGGMGGGMDGFFMARLRRAAS